MKYFFSHRNFIPGAFALICIFLLLCFPGAAAEAAGESVETWLKVILPTLLPFSILSGFFLQTGAAGRIFQKIPLGRWLGFSEHFTYVFCMSLVSGYPMGARLTADLYEQKRISSEEAARMVNAASTSGPSFLMAGVAVGMFRREELAWILLLSHVLSALITARCNGRFPQSRFSSASAIPPMKNPGMLFLSSVGSAVNSMLIILGSMVLFHTLSAAAGELMRWILPGNWELFSIIFSGILEFSTGCKAASALELSQALPLIAFFCGFGSFSVYLQTLALTAKSCILPHRLLRSKFLQGSFSALFTCLICLPKDRAFLPALVISCVCTVAGYFLFRCAIGDILRRLFKPLKQRISNEKGSLF